jgi:hypothetical protein
MCVALIGGMDRLKRHYINEAKRAGVELKVFNRPQALLSSRIRHADAVVIFTNKVSHRARKEAQSVMREQGVPVLMVHACGVCTLRDCLKCLKRLQGGSRCPQ